MQNKSFSPTFVATLTLVLISSILLSACQPEEPAAPASDSSGVMETAPATNSDPAVSQMGDDTTTADPSVLTLEPTYISPGGEERIRIMLTLTNGVVAEAEATSLAKHPTSQQMQAGFVEEFSGAVVGLTLEELASIDRIGGASLTTGAFRQSITELNQS